MKNKSFIIVLIVGIIIVVGIISFALIGFVLIKASNLDNNAYLKNIEFNISDKFEKKNYGDFISYYYFDSDNDLSCTFDVSVEDYSYNSYNDGKEYLEDSVYHNSKDKVSDIEEIDINNFKWYKMSVLNSGKYNYYYATIKNGVVYELKYDINDYLDGDRSNNDSFCITERDKIISSVVFK